MNTPAQSDPTTSPGTEHPRTPRGKERGPLRRAFERVVAFVVPPDDKIAQTWRWIQ